MSEEKQRSFETALMLGGQIPHVLSMTLAEYFKDEELDGLPSPKDHQALKELLAKYGQLTLSEVAYAKANDTGLFEEYDKDAFTIFECMERRKGNHLTVLEELFYLVNEYRLNGNPDLAFTKPSNTETPEEHRRIPSKGCFG